MKPELKPEPVRKPGQRWTRAFLDQLSVKERLEGLTFQDVFSHFTPQEWLEGLTLQGRLVGLEPQEVLNLLVSQEVLDQLNSKQIEECLEQLKRKKEWCCENDDSGVQTTL